MVSRKWCSEAEDAHHDKHPTHNAALVAWRIPLGPICLLPVLDVKLIVWIFFFNCFFLFFNCLDFCC